MEHKYQLGEEISIEFIGKITEISLGSNGKVYYVVDNMDTFARRVQENQMFHLPAPEDFEKKEGEKIV